jgi:hypothetical protein
MEGSSQTSGAELREELRGDAETVTGTAKDRIHSEVDARKSNAAAQAKSVSSALETAAGELSDSPAWLRSALEQGAQTLQRFAETIEQKDSRQLTRDVQRLAREHPAAFLGTCAAAGFVAARVLKAGAEERGTNGGYSDAEQSGPEATISRAYDPYEAQTSSSSKPVFGGMTNPQTGEPTYAGDLP